MEIFHLKDKNWLLIISLILGLILLAWIFWPPPVKKPRPNFIFCPLRKKYFPKYDNQKWQFTEEYQRIRLIIYFLKKGYSRRAFRLEYPLEKSFGHKGQTKVKILVDLVLIRNGRCYLVAEVKKDYSAERKKSAIEHQLKPAMSWTGSKYGIYWDGTRESCCLVREKDGTVRVEKFPS